MENTILVHDTSRFFYRHFKREYSTYSFEFFSGEEDHQKEYFEQFKLMIFIMGSPIEMIDFFKIYNKNIPIIFCCPFEKHFFLRKQEMELIGENIKLVDVSGTKIELKKQLKPYFETCND